MVIQNGNPRGLNSYTRAVISRPFPTSPTPGKTIPFRTQVSDLLETLRLVWQTSKTQTVYLVVLSVLQAFIPAASLWVGKLLLDAIALAVNGRLEEAGGEARLIGLLGIQVGIGVVGTLLSSLSATVRELLGDSLQNQISLKILNKASALEVERFENPETYDSLQSAYREVGVRPLGVLTQVVGLVQALITLTSIGALMAGLGWAVLPLVLLATVPGVWVSTKFGAESYRMIRYRTHDARVQNYLGGVLTSDTLVKEVRLFHFEPYLLGRWQDYYNKFRAQLVPLIRGRNLWSFAASIASALLIGLATLQVLEKAISGQLTVGDFSLFVLGISQVQGQFSTLLTGFSGIYQNLLYMRNLFEFLELPSRDLESGLEFQGEILSVEFDNVAFKYPFAEKNVLEGVSFKIIKGQALALVGENGAGKTTIVKLVTRLFEPTSGRILVNGQDASQFSVRSLQAAMSIIFQDFGQYQMSVRENVVLSDVDAFNGSSAKDSKAEVQLEQATSSAGAAFVGELEKGFDTQLGKLFQGGRNLSGGQWQRLALARLYYRGASMLIFDEPTAALDANAEFEVVEALRAHSSERITVIISHRFSTVRLADFIVVLEGGRVKEQGTHAELLELDGKYAGMYRLQARGYA